MLSVVSVCGGLFRFTPAEIDETTKQVFTKRPLPKSSVHDYIIHNGDTQTVYCKNGKLFYA